MSRYYKEFMKAFFHATLIFLFVTANVWYTESGALKAIQLTHQYYGPVLHTERHFFDLSRIIVRSAADEMETLCLDTDLFFNYQVKACKK